MTFDERVTDAVESGMTASSTKIYQLLSDSLAAISHHYAIPVGELLNVVKDELNHD